MVAVPKLVAVIMVRFLQCCKEGNVFDYITVSTYQCVLQTCANASIELQGVHAFIHKSKCYGIKNAIKSSSQKQQCTLLPKGKIDDIQFCGNHLKKLNKDSVLSVPVSTLLPVSNVQVASEAELSSVSQAVAEVMESSQDPSRNPAKAMSGLSLNACWEN